MTCFSLSSFLVHFIDTLVFCVWSTILFSCVSSNARSCVDRRPFWEDMFASKLSATAWINPYLASVVDFKLLCTSWAAAVAAEALNRRTSKYEHVRVTPKSCIVSILLFFLTWIPSAICRFVTLAVTMFAINKAGSMYWNFSDKLDSKESKVGLTSSVAFFFYQFLCCRYFYCHWAPYIL